MSHSYNKISLLSVCTSQQINFIEKNQLYHLSYLQSDSNLARKNFFSAASARLRWDIEFFTVLSISAKVEV